MALFFTFTLGISILGLITLLSLKHWELQTGKMLFSGARPVMGDFFHGVVFWVERVAPKLLRLIAKRIARATMALAHRTVAWVVVHVEKGLEYVLFRLRHSTSTEIKQEASPFLREVAEHKKELLKHAEKDRMIVEE